jgi:hypothetical protein
MRHPEQNLRPVPKPRDPLARGFEIAVDVPQKNVLGSAPNGTIDHDEQELGSPPNLSSSESERTWLDAMKSWI